MAAATVTKHCISAVGMGRNAEGWEINVKCDSGLMINKYYLLWGVIQRNPPFEMVYCPCKLGALRYF